MTKELIIATVEQMPETFQTDEFLERLFFLEKLYEAKASLDRGEGIPHEEAVRQIRDYMKRRKNERSNLDG